jgi:hypothetical protein
MGEFEYAIQLLRNKRHYYQLKLDQAFKSKQKDWKLIGLCEDRISDLNRAIKSLINDQFI